MHIAFAGGGISRITISEELKKEKSNSYNLSLNFDEVHENWIAGFTIDLFYNILENSFILQPVGQDEFGELFEKQKDNGWVKDILSLVVQDSAYSIPAFNMMRKAGVPKYPAFFLSAAFGAVGVENVDRDGDKTYFAPFQKDVQELKRLIGILPDTPADKIADEVHQALEYGTFGAAIPGIIDAFKFMKQYLPKFSTVTGSTAAVVGMTADNEAEGSPIKSILKAVDSAPMFKSAVVDAADKIPTVGSGDQIFNTIKNTPGVKANELKWMDLEGFLKNKNKVSKDEVLEYINATYRQYLFIITVTLFVEIGKCFIRANSTSGE